MWYIYFIVVWYGICTGIYMYSSSLYGCFLYGIHTRALTFHILCDQGCTGADPAPVEKKKSQKSSIWCMYIVNILVHWLFELCMLNALVCLLNIVNKVNILGRWLSSILTLCLQFLKSHLHNENFYFTMKVNLCNKHTRALTFEHPRASNFSKVISGMNSHSKYTWALTFENLFLCQKNNFCVSGSGGDCQVSI